MVFQIKELERKQKDEQTQEAVLLRQKVGFMDCLKDLRVYQVTRICEKTLVFDFYRLKSLK